MNPRHPTRRDVLRLGAALGGAAGAGLAWPVTAAADVSKATTPMTTPMPTTEAQTFDQRVASHPWLEPFKGVTDLTGERRCDALSLTGRWPEGLRGRFYRNGPALFERNGRRDHHWFAGDGMVQQFTLTGGGRPAVRHIGRLVRTAKLVAEQRAGRFLFDAYGTHFESDEPIQGPDSFNVANTSAIEHGGRLLAMWEGGSAYAMDPRDLSTAGPVTWRDGLAQMPFSAHPKIDAAGHLWNFGSAGDQLVVWHVDPRGTLVGAQVGPMPYPGGMAHDAAITARHIVLPLPPVKPHFGVDMDTGHAFTYEPTEPLRILVMEKDDITRQRVFELPSQMVFHVGNAHERGDGRIVLSFVASPTPDFVMHGAAALVAGRPANLADASTQLAVLDMRSGRATVESMRDAVEFPRVHPQRNGTATRYLVAAAAWRAFAPGDRHFHGVALRDLESGRVDRFDYGIDTVVEEHLFVPKPGRTGELDAWLLGTTYDAAHQISRLNLLDARHVVDGPIATAILPYVLPYGFHGNFAAA